MVVVVVLLDGVGTRSGSGLVEAVGVVVASVAVVVAIVVVECNVQWQ